MGKQENINKEISEINKEVASGFPYKNKLKRSTPIVVILLLGGAFYIGHILAKNLNSNNKTVSYELPSPIPMLIPTSKLLEPSKSSGEDIKNKQYQMKVIQEVKDFIKKVFNNEIPFDQIKPTIFTGNKYYKVPYFSNNFEFTPNSDKSFYLYINSYKYEAGSSKFMSGYEAGKWEIDLDKVVEAFLNLKPGTQIMPSFLSNPFKEVEVTLSTFGKRKYAVYDSYFPPGDSWDRTYETFDVKDNKLVSITFVFQDFNPDKKEITYSVVKMATGEELRTRPQYPENIQFLLRELEKVLSLY